MGKNDGTRHIGLETWLNMKLCEGRGCRRFRNSCVFAVISVCCLPLFKWINELDAAINPL